MSEDRPQQADFRKPPRNDDEIDLLELWEALKRRRLFILALTLGATLAAAVVVFAMPPTFESRAVIQVGQVAQIWQAGQSGQSMQVWAIERPPDLIERLKQEYRVGENDPPNPLPRIEAVEAADRRNPSAIVEIKAHARTPEEGRAFLRKVTDDLLQQHRKLFVRSISVQREERDRLATAAARIEEDTARFAREIERGASRSNALSAMLLLERSRRLSELSTLRSQIAQWDLLLSPANTYETRLIVEPTLRASPVKPRKALIIVLSGVIGLFLGAFLILVKSSASRART